MKNLFILLFISSPTLALACQRNCNKGDPSPLSVAITLLAAIFLVIWFVRAQNTKRLQRKILRRKENLIKSGPNGLKFFVAYNDPIISDKRREELIDGALEDNNPAAQVVRALDLIYAGGSRKGKNGEPSDHETAIKLLESAMAQGSKESVMLLGNYYADNEHGDFHFEEAEKYYLKALNLGVEYEVDAHSQLSTLYLEQAAGKIEFLQKAEYHMRQVIECGVFAAGLELGTHYESGTYGNQNYKEAYKYYELACLHSNIKALKKIEKLERKMKPEEIVEAKKLLTDFLHDYYQKHPQEFRYI